LLLFAFAAVSAQAWAQVGAKILSIQGTVEVSMSPWTPAVVNQILTPGAAIRTGAQSRAVILLADETQIKLNGSSQMVIREVRQSSTLLTRVANTVASNQSALSLLRGEAWLRSKLKPVNAQVGTPAVTASIRGTEFNIAVAEDGETTATVLEGIVDMRNDQGFVQVNAREQGRARVGQAPTKTIILNPEDAVQWTLVYTAAVSGRDYPFLFSRPEAARSAMASAQGDPLRTAQLQHDAGEAQAALASLQSVSTPESAAVRGWILLEQNNLKEAVEEFSRDSSQTARTRLGLSLAYFRLNQFNDAYQFVENTGGDDRLKLQKAVLDMIAGDAAGARIVLESIRENSPAYALAQGQLSTLHLVQNKKELALAAARKALQADSLSPSAHLGLSLVQQAMFDLSGATRSAERALQLDPNFLQADIQYAKLLFGSGDSGKAETIIRGAISRAPEESAAHSTLGFILLGRGDTGGARTSFEKSLQLDNTRGEPHLGIGIALMRSGKYTEAVTEFLTASSLEPRISLYQSYLGKAFYEQRKFDQAFSALAAARENDPRDPTPRLYSGIFENDLNRPGAAIREFEESIRLNDSRAVYRSQFVLDEDRATRNVNLAGAYNRLGLSEWANLHALRSNASDPANSSARIFLANTFLNLKGRTLAAGSELLMARLLLPVNSNSFNSFNDYTTLFELPRFNGTAEGSFGNFESYATTLTATGGGKRYAYSSVFRFDQSDGFRPLNDDSRDFTGIAFFKFALAPHSDLLFSYIHSQTQQGDHGAGNVLVSDDNSKTRRSFVRTHRAEIGFHQRLGVGSELVVVFSGQVNDNLTNDPRAGQYYLPPYRPVWVYNRHLRRDPDLDFQAAHLVKIRKLRLKYGVDIFEGRLKEHDVFIFPSPYDPSEININDQEPQRSKVRYKTIFSQADYEVNSKLTLTAGLNYDWANTKLTINEYDFPVGKWNPQAGFMYRPFESASFRFAAMRVMQTDLQEKLVPTHVEGFLLSQNESPLTLSNSYQFGWDQKFGSRSFLRASTFKRDRTFPVSVPLDNGDLGREEAYGKFYGGTATLNQFLTGAWTFVPEYSLNHSEDFFGIRHDHEGTLGTYYIHPKGFSVGIQENYLNQHGFTGETLTSTSVWTTNASISYEFPRKRGLISFQVKNLTDRRYAYLADPLALDPRIPRIQVKGVVRINF
jgi:tetratricopeptide (TPR) repeat protein